MSKICVIVGFGPGIGLAVARRFGKEDFVLALIARNAEKLQTYVNDLTEEGMTAQGFSADAGDATSLINAFDRIKSELGSPEVLIYNAAAIKDGKASELDPQVAVNHFRINTIGALISVQQVVQSMRTAGNGTILFTGGGLALNPNPDYASLAMGKAALRNLCYSLGAELEADGIFVGTVTIAGYVQPKTHFDPDLIAEKYWQLHTERHEREIIYR